MANICTTKLYEARKGDELQVSSVPNIVLLESLGIHAGTRLTVKTRYPLGGPVLIHVENTYSVAIGKDIAKQIEVFSEIKGSDKSELQNIVEVDEL
ncbi:MAG: ferrous iron transport protein A [Oscillospiraceae bacterium]|nr:ferrous iron transport protein A [Oscillospiraceae bacterium]